ncbi:hypothetical protein SA5R_14955 [Pantoea dispersa]|uniref:Uncharacterized protein n=1 Tax=Pantoea dispersa TaxID=59814 RepID=A0A8E1RVE2_9GAMM|nr:hypothetical protein SA2_13840 [Pantoea dispersa]KTS20611.1 hypothetical protein SA4R_18260 [Pantoea dispersa]KTS58759.1 hypothetical protein SA5R_14955 [Pantoea dispersa]KTS64502.1 hypothetical protein SA3R_22385 [Pantoea dispersa]
MQIRKKLQVLKVQLKIWVMRWTRQRNAPSDELVLRKMAKSRIKQILAKICRMLISRIGWNGVRNAWRLGATG